MTAAIVLAAGTSSRLGQPKQLLLVAGESLVRRAARVALEAGCAPVFVIEGAVRLGDALAGLPVEVVPCAEWAQGQGASLRRGVEALAGRATSCVVLLVDQLRVSAADVRALLAAPGDVAAAAYGDILGVPARFSGAMLEVLRSVPPERGARAWLAANAECVTAVPMPHAAVDLDEPADLARLEAR